MVRYKLFSLFLWLPVVSFALEECGCKPDALTFAAKLESITQQSYQGAKPLIELKVNYVRPMGEGIFNESIRVDYVHENEERESWTNRYALYFMRLDGVCRVKRYLMYRKSITNPVGVY